MQEQQNGQRRRSDLKGETEEHEKVQESCEEGSPIEDQRSSLPQEQKAMLRRNVK